MLTSGECFFRQLIQTVFIIYILIYDLAFEIFQFRNLSGKCIQSQIPCCLYLQSVSYVKIQVIAICFIGGLELGIIFSESSQKFSAGNSLISVTNQGLTVK